MALDCSITYIQFCGKFDTDQYTIKAAVEYKNSVQARPFNEIIRKGF